MLVIITKATRSNSYKIIYFSEEHNNLTLVRDSS